jgi:hypothetical protein
LLVGRVVQGLGAGLLTGLGFVGVSACGVLTALRARERSAV